MDFWPGMIYLEKRSSLEGGMLGLRGLFNIHVKTHGEFDASLAKRESLAWSEHVILDSRESVCSALGWLRSLRERGGWRAEV